MYLLISYEKNDQRHVSIPGQVGNVITNRNASRQEFERLLVGIISGMEVHSNHNDKGAGCFYLLLLYT